VVVRRLRLLAAAAVLAAAVGAAATASGSGPGDPVRRNHVAPTVPTDLRGSLHDTSVPTGPGLVRWTTTWELAWDPVPGAATYAVYAVGPEGEASAPMRVLREPLLRLSVAAGTTSPGAQSAQRDGQVAYRATQLGVRVVAVSEAGARGPSSPVVPVGQARAGSG
jgi:hypothetical protein